MNKLPELSSLKNQDEIFMREALREAYKAYEKQEVPIGAIVVLDGKILSRAHNQVELLQDATAHAEMLAITAAEEQLGSWRLSDAVLYTTIEPCMMCAGATILSRVSKIVYGANDIRVGACGSFINVFSQKHPIHQVQVTEGVLKEWCENIIKQFFQERRDEHKRERSSPYA